MHRHLWAAVLCVIVAPPGAKGQNASPGVITGHVRDAGSLAPVPGAIVTVTGTRLGTQADSIGRFRINGVPAGRVEVRARLVGYADQSDSVDVTSGAVVDVELRLRASAVTLGVVRSEGKPVERERFEQQPTLGSTVLSGKAISRLPRVGEADVLRSAQLLPGVQARNDYSAGLNVRGGEADQNLILMDGFPIFNPFHFGGLFGTFIDAAVGEVELLTGGYSARYGGRLSSVFDVRSAEENRSGLHGSSTVSVLATNLTIGSALPIARGSWSLSARRTYADQVFKLLGQDLIPYHFRDLQGHATYRLGASTSITTTLYNGRDAIEVAASADEEPFDFWWGNTVAGVRVNSTLDNGVELEQRLSWSRFGTGLDVNAGSLTLSNSIGEWRAGGDVRWTNGTHRRAMGYEVTNDRIRYEALSTSSDAAYFSRRQSPTAVALYADDIWRPNSRLLIDIGARAEQLNGTGWHGLSPRLSAKWFLTRNLAVTGAVGRYSQWLHSMAREDIPIRLFDFWAASDRHTPVSRATHRILGTEAWMGVSRFMRIEGYVKDYDALVEPNLADDVSREGDEFNSITGRSYGVDFLVRQLDGERWGGWLAYGYGYNTRGTPIGSHHPAQDRRHNLNLVATYRPSARYVVSGRFGYATGTPFTDILGEFARHSYNIRANSWTRSDSSHLEPLGGRRNASRFPDTQRLDVSVTRDFGRRMTVTPFLSLINAYNAQNVFMYVFDYGDSPPTRKALSQIPVLPTIGVTVAW